MRRSAGSESEKQVSCLSEVLPLAGSEAVEAASTAAITRYTAHLIVCCSSRLVRPRGQCQALGQHHLRRPKTPIKTPMAIAPASAPTGFRRTMLSNSPPYVLTWSLAVEAI